MTFFEAFDDAFSESLNQPYDPEEAAMTATLREQAIARTLAKHGNSPHTKAVIQRVLSVTEAQATEMLGRIYEGAGQPAPPPASPPASGTPAAVPDRDQLAKMGYEELSAHTAQAFGEVGLLPGTARESAPAQPASTFEAELAAATGGKEMKDLKPQELELLADAFMPRR